MKSFFAAHQSYATTTEDTDSQHSQKFGMSSSYKNTGSQESQNAITFTCRLSVANPKCKQGATTAHQSLQP
jgi:hypothetical protein